MMDVLNKIKISKMIDGERLTPSNLQQIFSNDKNELLPITATAHIHHLISLILDKLHFQHPLQ